MDYEIIIIGTSAGGVEALKELLNNLDNPKQLPIIVLQHISPNGPSYLRSILNCYAKKKALEVADKMEINDGVIYVPAPNYHLLMEKDWTFSLTVEEKVSYARPSIDVLFESVADACHNKVIALLLTGANHDGANGIKNIQENGGYAIIQQPSTAYASEMPSSGIRVIKPDFVGSIKEIKLHLETLISLHE